MCVRSRRPKRGDSETIMARILVTTLPHEGHLNPTFSISHKLKADGHEIIYLDHPYITKLISEQGFASVPFRGLRPGDLSLLWHKYRLEHSQGVAEMRNAILLFTTRLAPQARFIQQLIERHQPNLILNDAFHYGSALAAELSGLPWVDCWTAGVMHPKATPYLLPTSPAYVELLAQLFDQRWNAARRALGLPEDVPNAFLRPSRWLQIYTSCEAIDPSLPDLGPTAICIGPCASNRREQESDVIPADWLTGAMPLVYVSLGTFFNNRPDFIRRIVKAATGQNYRVVVSTPLAGKREFSTLPGNILLCKRVAQTNLLPHCALFVTHGGNNSVQEAMQAGIPMLVVPIAGEQIYNAERVKWLGLGERANIDDTDPREFRSLIQAMLINPDYRKNAEDIARKLQHYNGPKVAAQLILRLLQTGKPLARRDGISMSLTYDMALSETLH